MGKGVICRIEEDENMPVDADGNRAEVVMDSGSIINRMNLGKLYEHYISGASRDTRKRLQALLNYNNTLPEATLRYLKTLPAELIDQARTYIGEFFRIISDKQADFFYGLNRDDLLEYLRDILCDNLFIFYPIDNPKEITQIIRELEQKYPQCYSPVSYVGYSGERVTTERNVRIAPIYTMLLEKIADSWSAMDSGRMQHFGVLASMTKTEKYTFPFRYNPVRTIGETECRVLVGYCGQEAIAEMMDRANNSVTQKAMVWNILNAQNPTNIDYVIDRKAHNYGGSRPLALVNHVFTCSGFKLEYAPEKK